MVSVKSATVDNAVEVHDIDTATVVERYRTGLLTPDSSLSKEMAPGRLDLSGAIAALASSRYVTLAGDLPATLALFTGEGFAASLRGGDGSAPLSPVIEGQINPASSSAVPAYMIAAGEDRAVRFWDLSNVADSFIVCGSARDRDAVFRYAIGSALLTIQPGGVNIWNIRICGRATQDQSTLFDSEPISAHTSHRNRTKCSAESGSGPARQTAASTSL